MALVGCESEQEVAADMERALREANVAVLGALVSAELLTHVYDEPDLQGRHGYDVCGCPCTERFGTSAPYILTLDYNPSGCVPESGLLPTAMAGHAIVDFDGTDSNLSWDGLQFALEHPVDGELEGKVTPSDERVAIEALGTVTIGDEQITVDLDVSIDEAGVTLDGVATVASADPRPLSFRDVVLEWDDISPPCPAPGVGTATLENPDRKSKDVIVDFARPGDGFVEVTRDGRVSESADWCAYTSDLW
jgi:hypothetical protein